MLHKFLTVSFMVLLLSQAADDKKYELEVGLGVWSPLGGHFIATSSTVSTSSSANFSGYGMAPQLLLNLNYYTSRNFGFIFGLNPVIMDNTVEHNQVTQENSGTQINVLLGITGQTDFSTHQLFYYAAGLQVNIFDMTQSVTNSLDWDTNGVALGLFYRLGVKLKITQSLRLLTGLEYTVIPASFTYTNSSGASWDVDDNFGGMSFQTAVTLAF